MSDSGEGLVDAQARLQERMEERAAETRAVARPAIDPERERTRESLRLARAELARQAESTAHPVRRQQIQQAIAEIDRRLSLS
jgi:hypothetical protein